MTVYGKGVHMGVANADKEILRDLARQMAELAALPVHRKKLGMWQRLNALDSVRPMVFVTEMPWNEMNVDDEMTLRTQDEWSRKHEWELRAWIYLWKHMPVDYILNDFIASQIVIRNSGLGMQEDVDLVETDKTSSVVSKHFHPQLIEPKDVEKIHNPTITIDEAATEEAFTKANDVFGGIMPVRKVGFRGKFFAPWDTLIRWWGVEEAMIDLVMRPDMVREAVKRFVDAGISELDQMEKLNVMTLNNYNVQIGPGGYGCSTELPGKNYDPAHVRCHNMWGHDAAQIFVSVSPEMHWEFSLKEEMRWLKRWGLTYYGCCEPLDGKMDILRRIPNLRKISMSPWINVDRAVKELKDDYVFSYKPSPAILAEDGWRPEQARKVLREVLEKGRGCHIEVIMKDISTVRYKPQRLWDWAKMAMEEVEKYAK